MYTKFILFQQMDKEVVHGLVVDRMGPTNKLALICRKLNTENTWKVLF